MWQHRTIQLHSVCVCAYVSHSDVCVVTLCTQCSRGPRRVHRRLVSEAGDVSVKRHFHVPAFVCGVDKLLPNSSEQGTESLFVKHFFCADFSPYRCASQGLIAVRSRASAAANQY